METITFEKINHYGIKVFENDLYNHIHNPEMLLMYDCNFLQFKKNPTLLDFTKAEDYLREFHLKHDQHHLKFYFPENATILPEVREYLSQCNYHDSRLELYYIQPKRFPKINGNPEISVQSVTEENLDTFLKFQYELDFKYGLGYAEQRQAQHRRNFYSDSFQQVIAYFRGLPAASVDLIITDDTVEIDGLIVLDAYQKRGIGSMIQRYVMDQFMDKKVILVASGDDTPREMYIKQNYKYVSYKYEVMKVNE